MGYITEKKWYKPNLTVKWLNSHGFRYSKEYSGKDSDAYVYTFPVHRYNAFSLLECMLVIYIDNGEVIIKVQDAKTKETYPQFYYDSQGNHNKFVKKIENIIETEFSKLGIKELDNKIRLMKIISYSKYTKKFTYYCPICDQEVSKETSECENCGKAFQSVTDEDLEIAKNEVYIHE